MQVYREERNEGANLSPEQAVALERWLFDEQPVLTYAEARARLEKEFGARMSNGALGSFYQRRAKARLLERAVTAGQAGDPAWGQLGKSGVEAHRVLMEMAGRLGFDLVASGGKPSLNDLVKLVRMAGIGLAADRDGKRLRLRETEVGLKAKLVALKEREVKMKEKAAVAEAGVTANNHVEKQEKATWGTEPAMAA